MEPPSLEERLGLRRPWETTGASTFMPTSVTVGSSARRALSCTVDAGVSWSNWNSSIAIS